MKAAQAMKAMQKAIKANANARAGISCQPNLSYEPWGPMKATRKAMKAQTMKAMKATEEAKPEERVSDDRDDDLYKVLYKM